jgi:hypothetical protein
MKKPLFLFILLSSSVVATAQSIPAEVQELFLNQNSPQQLATDESFLIDDVVWSRPFGEKLYHLTPSVPNVSEYETQIHAEADVDGLETNGAKFYFAELTLNAALRIRLRDFYINVPDYIGQKVIVYLPLYQLNKLSQEGAHLSFLQEYGTAQPSATINSDKDQKALIWSDGFEATAIPGSNWNVGIGSGATNCGWKDINCAAYSGSWGAFCSGTCSTCQGHENNMNAGFSNKNYISTSGFYGITFYYLINLNLYSIGSNDEFKRYEDLGTGSWTLKATYNSSSSIDGDGWYELSASYSGTFSNWATLFNFYSNSVGTSDGVYLDDLRLTGNSNSNLEQVNTANALMVYPNPSNGQFEIQHELLDEFELLSSDGKLIVAEKAVQGHKSFKGNLDQGVYFVRGKLSNGDILTQKVVIH